MPITRLRTALRQRRTNLSQTSPCPRACPRGHFAPFCLHPRKTKTLRFAGLSPHSGGRIRTCDLRVMSLISEICWTTWSTVSSGFRQIELRGDRLESVGHVAPFVAPDQRRFGQQFRPLGLIGRRRAIPPRSATCCASGRGDGSSGRGGGHRRASSSRLARVR